jgi:inhibitor of KinA sporulation pathway (predicted exonuclease)
MAQQWGYTHKDKPHVINGGFKHLSELKQHLVNLKGEKKNVRVVSEGDFHRAVEDARKVQKLRGSI